MYMQRVFIMVRIMFHKLALEYSQSCVQSIMAIYSLVNQISVHRIGPSMVQQFQSRCDLCGGRGETMNGIVSVLCTHLCAYTCSVGTCMYMYIHIIIQTKIDVKHAMEIKLLVIEKSWRCILTKE